jgi:hypothetical protein
VRDRIALLGRGPAVVGIDLSSKAIDLVRIDENNDEAEWISVPLAGKTAWDRTRQIGRLMPSSSWWDDVYLCAIEQPFGPSRRAQSVLMRAQGAILAAVPDRVEVWEVTPDSGRSTSGSRRRRSRHGRRSRVVLRRVLAAGREGRARCRAVCARHECPRYRRPTRRGLTRRRTR